MSSNRWRPGSPFSLLGEKGPKRQVAAYNASHRRAGQIPALSVSFYTRKVKVRNRPYERNTLMNTTALSTLSKRAIKKHFEELRAQESVVQAIIHTAILFDHPEETVAEVLGFSPEELERLEEMERRKSPAAEVSPAAD